MEPNKPQRNLNDLYNVKALQEFDLGSVDFDIDLGFDEKDAAAIQRDIERLEEEERKKKEAQQPPKK